MSPGLRHRSVLARVTAGIGALVGLVLLLAGVPWLLAVAGRLPDPRTWTWSSFVALWTTPDTGAVLITLITLVAWAAWAVFVLSLVVELVGVLSSRRLRIRLPGLAGPQALAATLLLAVVGMLLAPLHAGADPVPAPPSGSTEPTAPRTMRVDDVRVPPADAGQRAHGTVHRAAPAEQRGRPDTLAYTVRAGDDLWSLAERFYGDGSQWRRIAEANTDRLTGGPDELGVGWRLTVPGVSVEATRPASVTVRAGDTLGSLAERYYHTSDAWRTIFEANRSIVSDPDQIEVGWRLRLPGSAGDPAPDHQSASADPGDQSGKPAAKPPDAPDRPDVPDRPVAPGPEVPTQPRVVPTRPPAELPTSTSRPSQPGQSGQPDQPSEAEQPAEEPVDAPSVPADLALVRAVGGLLAAALVAGLLARREWQLRNRPVGRRIPHPPPPASALQTALGRTGEPLTLASLDLALRAIAVHCRAAGDVPELELVLAGEQQIEFRFAEAAPSPPVGFGAVENGWVVDRDSQPYLESVPGVAAAPCLWPALISVGRTPQGSHVLVNLEAAGLLAVRPPGSTGSTAPAATGGAPTPADRDRAAESVTAVLTAIAMELSFSYWSGDLRITAVGEPGEPAPDWLAALSLHTVTWSTDPDRVIERAAARAGAQRSMTPAKPLGAHRLDPATADAWTPELLIFTGPLRADRLAAVERLMLDTPPVSLAAVVVDVAGDTPAVPRRAHRVGGSRVLQLACDGELAWLDPGRIELAPQRIDRQIRTSLVQLVSVTGREDTTPAPWWPDEPNRTDQSTASTGPDLREAPGSAPAATSTGQSARSLPATGSGSSAGTVTFLGSRVAGEATPPSGITGEELAAVTSSQTRPPGATASSSADGTNPVVRLLGPIDLLGAAGPTPTRATRQCVEYCVWLLEHPGATAVAMADALCVAEGTRRSNMSRLRTWLGDSPEGHPYLPEAYSGRIFLDPTVSSDWHRLQMLVGTGVNRAGTTALVGALELVRGAPLADAAPGQWYWAEELRTDMISTIRDVGVQLARTALAQGDVDLARWAASRALAAAPGDELLMCERIRTEHRAGNLAQVERLVLQVQGRARSLGVDLSDQTVDLMQHVVEGRLRARHA